MGFKVILCFLLKGKKAKTHNWNFWFLFVVQNGCFVEVKWFSVGHKLAESPIFIMSLVAFLGQVVEKGFWTKHKHRHF